MEMVSICNAKQEYDFHMYKLEGCQLYNYFNLPLQDQLSNFNAKFEKLVCYTNPKQDIEN